jgi:hypothetical protein
VVDSVDLPAGSQVTYTISGLLDGSFLGSLQNTASVTLGPGAYDLTPGDHSAADTTQVVPPDTQPPRIVRPVLLPSGFPPMACQEVRTQVTGMRLEADEALHDPTGDTEPDDVTNPANVRYVFAGPDGRLETVSCSEVVGDDQLFPTTSTWSAEGTALEISTGDVLQPGVWRLLLCDAVHDLAGNLLDGDGDGSAGGDFLQQLRYTPKALVEGAQFDCSVAGFAGGSLSWSADDQGGDPASGSARVGLETKRGATSASGHLEQCVFVPDAAAGDLLVAAAVAPLGGGEEVQFAVQCTAHQQPDCTDGGIGTSATPAVALASAATAGFAQLKWLLEVPPQTLAVSCVWSASSAAASSATAALFDALSIRDGAISFWDFESGQLPE